jgi:hypothetical protein
VVDARRDSRQGAFNFLGQRNRIAPVQVGQDGLSVEIAVGTASFTKGNMKVKAEATGGLPLGQ